MPQMGLRNEGSGIFCIYFWVACLNSFLVVARFAAKSSIHWIFDCCVFLFSVLDFSLP